MNKLILYHFPKSSCSRKVTFVLHYKGISYQEAIVNLERGEQKQPDFLRLNPFGQVPVLDYNGKIIYDSAVINEFLEETFPERSLLPTDLVARANVRLSTLYADQVFYPKISAILKEFRQRSGRSIIEKLSINFQETALAFLESQLQEQADPFLFGLLTLADIAYAPGLETLIQVSNLSLTPFPATRRWLDSLGDVPAFRSSSPLTTV